MILFYHVNSAVTGLLSQQYDIYTCVFRQYDVVFIQMVCKWSNCTLTYIIVVDRAIFGLYISFYMHNFTCTSSNIIYCISCSKCCKLYIGETGRRLSDRFAEHLRSVRDNDVDKPVARHFNAVNHSISDIKVCAISPISGGNDSRKRHKKRLIFKNGTFIPMGLTNDFLLFDHILQSFRFCLARADKGVDFSLHFLCSFTSHSFISRLRIIYWSTLKIANDLPIFASYYAFVIVSLTWLALLSVTWLSLLYKFTRFSIYFLFLSDDGSMLETLDYTIRIGSTPTFLYFDLYLFIIKQSDTHG